MIEYNTTKTLLNVGEVFTHPHHYYLLPATWREPNEQHKVGHGFRDRHRGRLQHLARDPTPHIYLGGRTASRSRMFRRNYPFQNR